MAMKARVEHQIPKKDGTIGVRRSYGRDPRRSKGCASAQAAAT
jgi:hypothetical protein